MTGSCVPAAPRSRTRFTVVLPIVRAPRTLEYAVSTVLSQRLSDLELVILCDGSPPETVAAAERLAATDRRARVAAFPKGENFGEAHRHTVLGTAAGERIAQLGDDDLWFPDHLQVMDRLLDKVDFGTVCQIRVRPDGSIFYTRFGDLGDQAYRDRLVHDLWNFVGPTECSYRLSAYNALPEGWSPCREAIPHDLSMWRKFLRHPGLTFATRFAVTALKFGSKQWKHEDPADLAAMIKRYHERLESPSGRRRLRSEAMGLVYQELTPGIIKRLLREDPRRGLVYARMRLPTALAWRTRKTLGRLGLR